MKQTGVRVTMVDAISRTARAEYHITPTAARSRCSSKMTGDGGCTLDGRACLDGKNRGHVVEFPVIFNTPGKIIENLYFASFFSGRTQVMNSTVHMYALKQLSRRSN